MKKLILSASFAFSLLVTSNTFAQQGFGTNEPDKSAAVDIVSSKRGLLIPRISITDLDQAAPVNQPANALFVYNTNAATGEGFYYWERDDKTLPTPTTYAGRWVRFTSSINEKKVIVTAGDNVQVDPTTSTDGLTTTYTVGVQGGTENGQVLVTKVDGATTTTEWVNPADFIQGINGITVEQVTDPTTGIVENVVKLGGILTEDTTIITDGNKVMIQGLSQVTDMTDQVVAVGHYQTGEVKVATPGQIVSNTLTDGSGTTAVYDATTGKNQVDLGGKLTKPAVIETEGANTIAITGLNEVATADLTANDKIVIMGNDGVLKITSRTSLLDAKDLTLGDGLAFETGIANNDGVGAVLKATKLEIKDKSVLAEKLLAENPTGSTDPLAGKVATADANGNVTYQAITPASLTDKKTLSTDGIIVVGADALTATANTIADAVLTPTYLKIKDESITSTQILNGTIQTVDMQSGGNSKVLVTAADGTVSWIDQSDLGNKDNYNFAAPLNKDAGTANTTGGLEYAVTIANANRTTVGVVREADIDPTVNVVDGVLSVNLTNTVLAGDVTGPLSGTKVEKIQGTAVSATSPTATNNVLVYNNTTQEWIPTELTGDHITGKALSSTSITVTPETGTTNTALLEALNIEITPATEEGLVLTTTGTAGNLTTSWEKPTASYSTTNVNIAGDTNYSPYIAEIVLEVTLAGADQTVEFPVASAANEGQTISIKIANTDENHDGYLNVLDTYGTMPYQGWIVKSNGSKWLIVGRN